MWQERIFKSSLAKELKSPLEVARTCNLSRHTCKTYLARHTLPPGTAAESKSRI